MTKVILTFPELLKRITMGKGKYVYIEFDENNKVLANPKIVWVLDDFINAKYSEDYISNIVPFGGSGEFIETQDGVIYNAFRFIGDHQKAIDAVFAFSDKLNASAGYISAEGFHLKDGRLLKPDQFEGYFD